MTKATLNIQYDYITLRIKYADKSTLNITRSRNGIKMSGSLATREAMMFLDKLITDRTVKGVTLGDTMRNLRAIAEESNNVQDFLKAV